MKRLCNERGFGGSLERAVETRVESLGLGGATCLLGANGRPKEQAQTPWDQWLAERQWPLADQAVIEPEHLFQSGTGAGFESRPDWQLVEKFYSS